MKYIYYPEYELEYSNLIKRGTPGDHILNLRLLMFLCDHVILPPSHLLNTSSGNILSLITYMQDFFHAGKIVTTRYPGGIENYFDARVDRIQDAVERKNKEVQAGLIQNELLGYEVEHNQSDEKTQLSLFDSRVKELVQTSPVHKKKAILLLDNMRELSDRTGEPIYSSQLRAVLQGLRRSGDMTEQQRRYFSDLMSRAYYYSGTYTMDTLVSYNSYFDRIDLQNSLLGTHKDATNLIVNPHFLGRLFEIMGICPQDLSRLTPEDYREIMSLRAWGDFMTVFDSLYTSAQELEELLRNRQAMLAACERRKEGVFKFFDAVLADLLIPIAASQISPAAGYGVPFVISLLRKFFSPVARAESFVRRNSTDVIVQGIEQKKDPLFEFCCELKEYIGKLMQ